MTNDNEMFPYDEEEEKPPIRKPLINWSERIARARWNLEEGRPLVNPKSFDDPTYLKQEGRVPIGTSRNDMDNKELAPINPSQPLVPQILKIVALIAGPILMGLGTVIPAPFGGPVSLLGYVALFLAGSAAKMPNVASSKPLLPLAVTPIAGSLAALVVNFSDSLASDSKLKLGLMVFAGLLSWLSGKVLPEPKVNVPAAKVEPAAEEKPAPPA